MKKYLLIFFTFLFFNTYAQIQGTYKYRDLENGFSILREKESGLNGLYNQQTNKLVLPIKYESVDKFTDQLLLIEYNNKFGLTDYKGNFIIEPKYERISLIRDSLFSVKKNNLQGVINQKDEIFIDFKYDQIYELERGTKQGYYLTKKNNLFGLIDPKGKEIVKPIYHYIYGYNSDYCFVEYNNLTGVIDVNGNELVKPIYSQLTQIGYDKIIPEMENYFYAFDYKKGKVGILDNYGNIKVPIEYESIWMINQSEINLEERVYALYLSEKENEKYGLINDKAEVILPAIYDEISGRNEGFYLITKNNKEGFLDKHGKLILSPKYDYIDYREGGIYIVGLNDFEGLIDEKGKEIIPPMYNHITPNVFRDNEYFIYSLPNEKRGLIDRNNKEILPPIYDYIIDLNNFILLRNDDKFQLYNRTNKEFSAFFTRVNFGTEDKLIVIEDKGKYGILYNYDNEIPPIKYTREEINAEIDARTKSLKK